MKITTATFELSEQEFGTIIGALEAEFTRTYATYGRRMLPAVMRDNDEYEGDPATALKRLQFLKGLNAKLTAGYEQTRGVK